MDQEKENENKYYSGKQAFIFILIVFLNNMFISFMFSYWLMLNLENVF